MDALIGKGYEVCSIPTALDHQHWFPPLQQVEGMIYLLQAPLYQDSNHGCGMVRHICTPLC